MTDRSITIFGGSGFVGRYIVQRLARRGWTIRVAVRRPESALFLKPLGHVGQITPVFGNVRDDASVAAAMAGTDAVVNLVGILSQRGRQRFDTVHAEGARRIAEAARRAGMLVLAYLGGSHAVAGGLRNAVEPLQPDGIFDDMHALPDLVRSLQTEKKAL